MKTVWLSIEYFKSGRIEGIQKDTNAAKVEAMKKSVKRNAVFPPVDVTYLSKEGNLSLIDGHHRVKAHIEAGAKQIKVNFISRKELTANIFKRTFQQKGRKK